METVFLVLLMKYSQRVQIDIDEDEPVGSAGLGAAVVGTRVTTLGGGLKYTSNI
ncbi:hypothetical protein Tco_0063773, partial [Tanacetum coccineum]